VSFTLILRDECIGPTQKRQDGAQSRTQGISTPDHTAISKYKEGGCVVIVPRIWMKELYILLVR
jgi:hypothetical protein